MLRTQGRRFAEIVGASSLALSQPLLDVFGRSTETFLFRGVDGRGLVLFGCLIALGPPVALWVAGGLIGVALPRRAALVQATIVGALTGLAALVAIRWFTEVEGVTAAVVAVVVAASVTALFRHRAAVRTFFGYLAILPAVSLAGFVLVSPASSLVGGADVDLAASTAEAPVVVLVLDEFPTAVLLDEAGAVDPRRYPNFARLAEDATWYRNYTTLNASTVRAVPTLLTGMIPRRDDEPVWTDRPDNLFSVLGASHQMRVRETVTQLCPPSLCDHTLDVTNATTPERTGLGPLLGDALDVAGQLFDPGTEPRLAVDAFEEDTVTLDAIESATPGDDEVAVQPARFTAFVDDLVAGDEPILHFLHLILPHGPWTFTDDGTRYQSPEIDPPGQISGTWTDPWPAALTRLRLELQARYTDRLIGEVIERLETSTLWDDATVVVVADHGGSFIAGEPGRALSDANAHEVMWTPLFIRSPGLRPGPTDVNAQAVDVLATVAELLDTPLGFETDGRPLVRRVGDGFVPVAGVGDDSGQKLYARFTNAFQPEDDALLEIDVASNLARVLDDGRAVSDDDADDPIGAFQRTTEHGDLYRQPVRTLKIGGPAEGRLRVDRRDALESGGGDDAEPLYVGGALTDGADDVGDQWIAIALDGRIVGLSAFFTGAEDTRAFATMISPHDLDPDGGEVTAWLIDADGTLHLVPVS